MQSMLTHKTPVYPLSPELAWAAYLVASWWGKNTVHAATAPSPDGVAPEAVISILRRNGVPLLTLPGDTRPPAADLLATAPWQVALAEDRARLARQQAAFAEIRAAWAEAGIPALFVKSLGPPPSFPYTSGNLDVLVPQNRQDEARKLVRDLGYVELRHIEEPNKFLLRRYHLGESAFDIHIHGRVEWHVSFLDEAALWQHSTFAPDTNVAAVPSLEDGVLITLAHALYENKAYKLSDLAKVLYATGTRALDWDRMAGTARRKGWLSGFWFALGLCTQMEKVLYGTTTLATKLPKAALASLSRRQRAYLGTLFAGPLDVPVGVSFTVSKRLFYEKMLGDTTQPLATRAKDIVSHTLYGSRVRLHLHSQKPLLISLDGIDGCGKSAQAQLLAKALQKTAIRQRIVWSRGGSSTTLQPLIRLGKTLLGQDKRSSSHSTAEKETERTALFNRPLVKALWPWLILLETGVPYLWRVGWPLLRGEVVVADRYLLSTLMELGARLDRPDIGQTLPGRLLRLLAPRPTYSFWFDVPWQVALARKGGEESPDFLRRQAELLPALAARLSATRLDGTQPLDVLSDQIVTETLRGYLDAHHTLLNSLFWSNPRPLPAAWREEH